MAALFLTVFIDMVGFGIVIPLLPFYAQRYGASPDEVTLLVTAYTLTQFVFAPFWGRVSDRYGRRSVLLVTLAGTAVAYVWTGLAESLVMLFVARAFAGASAANVAVAHAYVADIAPPEHRAREMGKIGAAFGLGFVIGPAIGGLLAAPDAAGVDYMTPFLVAAGFSVVAWVLALIQLKETVTGAMREAAAQHATRGRLASLAESLSRPWLGRLIVLMFMTPFVFSGVESTFALWSERALAWGPVENGYVYSYMGVIAVLTQGAVVGRLVRRVGEVRAIQIGALAVLVGSVALPFSLALAPLLVSLGLIVFGVCVTGPSLNSLISRFAAAHERGAILGIAQSSSGLARILGPGINGYAFAGLGRDAPYYLGGLVMIAMLVIGRRLAGLPRGDEAAARSP